MSYGISERKVVGRWLALAVSADETRPALQGIIHGAEGWCFSTDGHRANGARGLSDGSGRARCPHSTEWLQEEPPDIGQIVHAAGEASLSVTCDGRGLLACLEGVGKAAKRAGAERASAAVVTFEERKRRITVGMSHGEFSAGIVLTSCAFEGEWGPPVTIGVRATYLVDALLGMVSVDPEAQVAITTEAGGSSPVHVRLIPNVVTHEMVAVVMPLRLDEGQERGVQSAMAFLEERRADPAPGRLDL